MRPPAAAIAGRVEHLSRLRDDTGQAAAETVLMTMLFIGWSGALAYFFPDMLNALQIYMDGFTVVLSLPIP